MASVFKLTEIVDMGIEKEKARRDFYDLVSKQFQEKELKDLFTRLRDWEDEHIKKFNEIRDTLNEPDSAESFPGEATSYVKTLVDDMLYKQVSAEQFSNNVKTPLSAIEYGIGFEKDAILFFVELATYAVSSKKEVIQKLVDEEKQHIIYLTELKKKI